jgi:hypothetical protein
MRLMSEAAEAARQYGELYEQSTLPDSAGPAAEPARPNDQFAGLSEQEKLNQLTTLTGRLRDSLGTGEPDQEIERDMRTLGAVLPAKYHVGDLVVAAAIRGERGQNSPSCTWRGASSYTTKSISIWNGSTARSTRLQIDLPPAGSHWTGFKSWNP